MIIVLSTILHVLLSRCFAFGHGIALWMRTYILLYILQIKMLYRTKQSYTHKR